MKTYGYLPIVMEKDMSPLTDHPERHEIRYKEAVTELISALATIQHDEIRAVLAIYQAKLVEKEDGSRKIFVSFPEKRFH